MRGVTSILAGFALLGLALWAFWGEGASKSALAFAAGGAFLLVRGWQGLGITKAGDFMSPMSFIQNPARAIVDSAIDAAGELIEEKRKTKLEAEEASSFDPDAALARYMANRPEPPVGAEPAPARRSFGRKGL
jgi:hypothetical protein